VSVYFARLTFIPAIGMKVEFWLNLQCLYYLRIAENRAASEIRRLPKLKRTERVPG